MNEPAPIPFILLVEDDPNYRLVFRRAMGQAFAIVEACTLQEAVGKLHLPFDCVVADLGLPDCKREETVPRIIEICKSSLLVVALSGYEQPEFIRQTIRDGAADYLLKGRDDQDPATLLSIIGRHKAHIRAAEALDRAGTATEHLKNLTRDVP